MKSFLVPAKSFTYEVYNPVSLAIAYPFDVWPSTLYKLTVLTAPLKFIPSYIFPL